MQTNNEWTIVQNTRSLCYYQYCNIDPSVITAVNNAISPFTPDQRAKALCLLKLFECFLQITGKRLSLLNLSSPKFSLTIDLFIGALWSDRFVSASIIKRYNYTYLLYQMLTALQASIPALYFSKIFIESKSIHVGLSIYVKRFELLALIEERVYCWRGWRIYSKSNMAWFVPLNGIYERYGYAFTERIFNQIKMIYAGKARSLTSGFTDFCRWLPTSDYVLAQFDNAADVQRLFQDFFVHFLTTKYRNGEGSSVKHLIIRWRRLISFMEKYFIGHIFAEPYGKLVLPQSTTIIGEERRIKTTADGIDVKEKLLTDIPLHVTDEEALELLFSQIQTDYSHVVATAESEANNLWQRFQRRKTLAQKGVVKPIRGTTDANEKSRQWITHKNNPDWLANSCATFESCGFTYDNNGRPLICSSYSLSVGEVAFELGLPTHYSLLPYIVLLVAEHPNIVKSFLTEFKLYNKQGKLTGFVQLDGGWVLDGFKHRSGVANAQQIVPLTIKSKMWIEQIIAMTDCVRQHLKMSGDDNWRYLFLSCGKSTIPGRMPAQYAHARRHSKKSFYDALYTPTQDITQEQAEKICARFNLGSLRASKAVLIYLETRNVEIMSKALGHKNYNPRALAHYLPTPIFSFFQSRWIRIFQQGMIVEAMKDSHLLLESTEFNSMNEFHDFMKNHALKTIPTHLENPDDENIPSIPTLASEIIFSINTAVLTMLISLQQAVANAKKRVCGRAIYWSEVAGHLVAHIECRSNHVSGEDFKIYLEIAKNQANPDKMEAIIYG